MANQNHLRNVFITAAVAFGALTIAGAAQAQGDQGAPGANNDNAAAISADSIDALRAQLPIAAPTVNFFSDDTTQADTTRSTLRQIDPEFLSIPHFGEQLNSSPVADIHIAAPSHPQFSQVKHVVHVHHHARHKIGHTHNGVKHAGGHTHYGDTHVTVKVPPVAGAEHAPVVSAPITKHRIGNSQPHNAPQTNSESFGWFEIAKQKNLLVFPTTQQALTAPVAKEDRFSSNSFLTKQSEGSTLQKSVLAASWKELLGIAGLIALGVTAFFVNFRAVFSGIWRAFKTAGGQVQKMARAGRRKFFAGKKKKRTLRPRYTKIASIEAMHGPFFKDESSLFGQTPEMPASGKRPAAHKRIHYNELADFGTPKRMAADQAKASLENEQEENRITLVNPALLVGSVLQSEDLYFEAGKPLLPNNDNRFALNTHPNTKSFMLSAPKPVTDQVIALQAILVTNLSNYGGKQNDDVYRLYEVTKSASGVAEISISWAKGEPHKAFTITHDRFTFHRIEDECLMRTNIRLLDAMTCVVGKFNSNFTVSDPAHILQIASSAKGQSGKTAPAKGKSPYPPIVINGKRIEDILPLENETRPVFKAFLRLINLAA